MSGDQGKGRRLAVPLPVKSVGCNDLLGDSISASVEPAHGERHQYEYETEGRQPKARHCEGHDSDGPMPIRLLAPHAPEKGEGAQETDQSGDGLRHV